MAGTLKITDTETWMPAGWLYDNVLEGAASFLDTTRPALAADTRRAMTTVSVGWLDLRPLSDDEFDAFVEAVDHTVACAKEKGSQAFSMPEFFPGFMKHAEQLRRQLHDAKRLRGGGANAD